MAKCPIINDDGNPKNLLAIKYEDLKQLEDYEEGYVAEYKGTFDDNVKEKLPKIIASFANASGGWVFIGINDDGKYEGIPSTRSDFSQTISQIIKAHITPMPIVNTHFVKNGDSGKGVLILEVLEGTFPPYIADGRVSYRVCSSSNREDPYNADADARVLLELHNKAKRFEEELNEFNRRTICFPSSKNGYTFPIFNIYIKSLYPKTSYWLRISDLENLYTLLSDTFKKCLGTSCYFQDSSRSIIARPCIIDSTNPCIYTVQLYYDGSIKLTTYFDTLHDEQLKEALQTIKENTRLDCTDRALFIDGLKAFTFGSGLCLLAKYLLQNMPERFRSDDFAFCTEFENTEGVMLYFDDANYIPYIKEIGIPFFATYSEKSEVHFASDFKNKAEWTIEQSLLPNFLSSCSFPISSPNRKVKNLLSKLIHQEVFSRFLGNCSVC